MTASGSPTTKQVAYFWRSRRSIFYTWGHTLSCVLDDTHVWALTGTQSTLGLRARSRLWRQWLPLGPCDLRCISDREIRYTRGRDGMLVPRWRTGRLSLCSHLTLMVRGPVQQPHLLPQGQPEGQGRFPPSVRVVENSSSTLQRHLCLLPDVYIQGLFTVFAPVWHWKNVMTVRAWGHCLGVCWPLAVLPEQMSTHLFQPKLWHVEKLFNAEYCSTTCLLPSIHIEELQWGRRADVRHIWWKWGLWPRVQIRSLEGESAVLQLLIQPLCLQLSRSPLTPTGECAGAGGAFPAAGARRCPARSTALLAPLCTCFSSQHGDDTLPCSLQFWHFWFEKS